MDPVPNKVKPLFRDLAADDPEPETTEIESLCLRCGENGITKLLLTKIPFYREVVIMSFTCNSCFWENNELQSAGKVQDRGVRYNLKVTDTKDLSRQVVKTEMASVFIPELEFEVPPKTQEGVVTTIEGIIDRAVSGLSGRLSDFEESNREMSQKIADFLQKLDSIKRVSTCFHFILDDPSGNSFVENYSAPLNDANMEVSHYTRSKEQDQNLGMMSSQAAGQPSESGDLSSAGNKSIDHCSGGKLEGEALKDEVLTFPTNCPNCNSPCQTNMKVSKIPHFKEAVIMATACDVCGHRTNEVKSGSGFEPMGTRITLSVTTLHDMTRDVLKSETCSISIPELELEVGSGTLGGRFTTLEGLLQNMKEQLREKNPIVEGDSVDMVFKERMKEFLMKLDMVINGKKQVTIILDDPCGNSYVQNLYAPEPDPNMTVEKYERTFDQNEELGLNDMKTENYT